MLGMLVVLSLAGTGCSSGIDRATAPDTESSTSPELVKEATEYGNWVLPANGNILLVKREIIRDRKYQIAVEMSPTDLTWMLEQSRFTDPLEKDFPPYLTKTIAGPDLASSPNVQHAQDTFLSQEKKSMIRDVVVDERAANTRIVHIEFRGV
ncbi:hypothetical protein [Nocardia sp. NPDC057440]|uniref:hypothetical protein n=1 Tax=Nocardia sp. NPDC057440 TaxID=3346134 RepID=UPI00366FFEF0